MNVFISTGRPHTEKQEKFITAVEDLLRQDHFVPQTVGRNIYSIKQPVRSVCDYIRDSHGAVIIAFERIRVHKGAEKPGSAHEEKLRDISLPTVWNQLEAAMAYANDLPILTLVERGLERQGMLSDRVEWYAQEILLEPETLQSDEFIGVYSDWKNLVRKHASEQRFKPNQHATAIAQIIAKLINLLKRERR